jgi:hypothetical protein
MNLAYSHAGRNKKRLLNFGGEILWKAIMVLHLMMTYQLRRLCRGEWENGYELEKM